MTNTNNDDQLFSAVGKALYQIKSNKAAIFCGAGISFNSGLPLANDILRDILSKIDVEDQHADLILKSSLPFESFIETIKSETDIDDILEIFNSGRPNTNHNLIAKLASSGHVSTILTTNFDTLIEIAMINEGLVESEHFWVFRNEEEFGKINWHDGKVKLIKIHGCVSDKAMMAITMEAVANQTYCINKNSVVRNFFSKDVNESVIILGYSCSDLFDLSPQIERLTDNFSKVLLVEHCTADSLAEALTEETRKNPFRKFTDGVRIKTDTNSFVKDIWESFYPATFEFICFPQGDWKNNINEWLGKAIERGTIGAKYHLSARLFYGIGEFELAVKSYQNGIDTAYMLQEPFNVCSELGNMAMTLNALSRFDEAIKCLKTSLRLCGILNNVQGEISQLQCLGNIYLSLADYQASESAFKKAVILSQRHNLPDSLCTALGNLALVYNAMQRYDETIECVKIGIGICHELGNKQAEASQLSSLGIAYFQTGDKENAIECLQKARDITKLIGDKRNESMILGNLANYYTMAEEYDSALEYAFAALQISTQTGTKQIEGLSNYWIGTAFNYKNEVEKAIPYLEIALIVFLQIYSEDHPYIHSAKKAISLARYRLKNPDFPNPIANFV